MSHPIAKAFRGVLYSEILAKYAQVKNKTVNDTTEEKKFDSTQKHDNKSNGRNKMR